MPALHEILPSLKQGRARLTAANMLGELLELVCPSECSWCEELLSTRGSICEECSSLFTAEYHACLRCGTQLPATMPTESCVRCRKGRFGFDQVIALGPYRGHFQQAVLLSKKWSYEDLRQVLARFMADRLSLHLATANLPDNTEHVVLPVPDHWSRKLGTSRAMTAIALARHIGLQLKLPVLERAIRRIRKTSKQGLLPWSQRGANVRGAFEITDADSLTGRHVVLVDDVLTSGATASEIGKMLRKVNVSKITVLVIARGTGLRE